MNIAGVEFNFNTQAIEVYLSGCLLRCPDCHNREAWSFDRGIPWLEAVEELDLSFEIPLMKHLWIMGGEPLDQDREEFLNMMRYFTHHKLKRWLWTGYSYSEVLAAGYTPLFHYVKTGMYMSNMPAKACIVDGLYIELASSNQRFHQTGTL